MPQCCLGRWLLNNPPVFVCMPKNWEESTKRGASELPRWRRLNSRSSFYAVNVVCAAESGYVWASPHRRPYLAHVWPVTSSRVPEELLFPSCLVGPSSFLHTPTESLLDCLGTHSATHAKPHTHTDTNLSLTHRYIQMREHKSSTLLCNIFIIGLCVYLFKFLYA